MFDGFHILGPSPRAGLEPSSFWCKAFRKILWFRVKKMEGGESSSFSQDRLAFNIVDGHTIENILQPCYVTHFQEGYFRVNFGSRKLLSSVSMGSLQNLTIRLWGAITVWKSRENHLNKHQEVSIFPHEPTTGILREIEHGRQKKQITMVESHIIAASSTMNHISVAITDGTTPLCLTHSTVILEFCWTLKQDC